MFPTRISHLQLGTTPRALYRWDPHARVEDLFQLALGWIREDREVRRVREKERGRIRGPRPEASAEFFRMWSGLVLMSRCRPKTPRRFLKSTTIHIDQRDRRVIACLSTVSVYGGSLGGLSLYR